MQPSVQFPYPAVYHQQHSLRVQAIHSPSDQLLGSEYVHQAMLLCVSRVIDSDLDGPC